MLHFILSPYRNYVVQSKTKRNSCSSILHEMLKLKNIMSFGWKEMDHNCQRPIFSTMWLPPVPAFEAASSSWSEVWQWWRYQNICAILAVFTDGMILWRNWFHAMTNVLILVEICGASISKKLLNNKL